MFSMRIEGGQELAATLRSLSTRLSKQLLREALIDGGLPMVRVIEQKAPRAAGAPDMADHIVIAPVRDQKNEASVGIGMDSKEFFYDLFQERGTARHKAQPFYRPAFDEMAPRAVTIIGDELWRQLAARGFQRRATAPGGLSGPDAFTDTGAGLGAGRRQATPRGRRR